MLLKLLLGSKNGSDNLFKYSTNNNKILNNAKQQPETYDSHIAYIIVVENAY